MIATNHALTGAIIGSAAGNPWVAVPAALVSHFVCDAIPHFGVDERFPATKVFRVMLMVDAGLCVLLVGILAGFQVHHWLQASICAFIAASPDLWSIKRFVYIRRGKAYHFGRFARFARRIQWFERPVGAVVEVAWLLGAIIILKVFATH